MKPWRVSRPVVADSHLFDEEQDPDPHYSALGIQALAILMLSTALKQTLFLKEVIHVSFFGLKYTIGEWTIDIVVSVWASHTKARCRIRIRIKM